MKSIPCVIVEKYYRFVKRQMKSIPSSDRDNLFFPIFALESAQDRTLSARQTILRHPLEHNVLEVVFGAEGTFFWLVPVLVHRVDIGLKAFNLGFPIHPTIPG